MSLYQREMIIGKQRGHRLTLVNVGGVGLLAGLAALLLLARGSGGSLLASLLLLSRGLAANGGLAAGGGLLLSGLGGHFECGFGN